MLALVESRMIPDTVSAEDLEEVRASLPRKYDAYMFAGFLWQLLDDGLELQSPLLRDIEDVFTILYENRKPLRHSCRHWAAVETRAGDHFVSNVMGEDKPSKIRSFALVYFMGADRNPFRVNMKAMHDAKTGDAKIDATIARLPNLLKEMRETYERIKKELN